MKSRSLKYIACIMICFLMGLSIRFTSHAAKSINENDILWGNGRGNVLQVGDDMYLSLCSGSYEGLIKNTGIIRYNVKTKKVKKLSSIFANCMYYYDGNLYAYNDYAPINKGCMYKINVKTGKQKRILSGVDEFSEIYKDRMYFVTKKGKKYTLYSICLDGTDKRRIVTSSASISPYFYENELFFYNYNEKVSYVVTLEGNNKRKIVDGRVIGATDDKIIYYVYNDEYKSIYYEYDKATQKSKKLSFLKNADVSYMDGDTLYYFTNENYKYKYYSITTKGKDKKRLSSTENEKCQLTRTYRKNKKGNKAGYTWALNSVKNAMYVAIQDDKYYYTQKGKLYVQAMGSKKKRAIKTVPNDDGLATTVVGIVGNNIILEELSGNGPAKTWKRKIVVYNMKSKKSRTVYNQ